MYEPAYKADYECILRMQVLKQNKKRKQKSTCGNKVTLATQDD